MNVCMCVLHVCEGQWKPDRFPGGGVKGVNCQTWVLGTTVRSSGKAVNPLTIESYYRLLVVVFFSSNCLIAFPQEKNKSPNSGTFTGPLL